MNWLYAWRYWNAGTTDFLQSEIAKVPPWSSSWRWIALVLFFRPRAKWTGISIKINVNNSD